MHKSGWAAATGLGSLVLLLAACGGSSSSSGSAAGPASGAALATVTGGASAPATTPASATQTGSQSSASPTPVVHHSVGPQASSGTVSFPPVGTTVLIVQKSSLGYVLAEANGQVVYTYSKDTKGGSPSCTGSCATTWPPVTGVPKAGPADTFPGTFTVVKGAGGKEQIAYEGKPLYVLAGARPLTTKGNGLDGEWHVIQLSESDITG